MNRKVTIYTSLDEDDVKKLDELINKKEFDSRSSFIRKAVVDKLKELEQKILA